MNPVAIGLAFLAAIVLPLMFASDPPAGSVVTQAWTAGGARYAELRAADGEVWTVALDVDADPCGVGDVWRDGKCTS